MIIKFNYINTNILFILPLFAIPIIYKKIKLFFNNKKKIVHPELEYYKLNKKKLLLSFVDKEKYNSNIDTIFYDKNKYLNIINEEGNNIEKIWKTRILIESTPRGNIIMFYDPYKLGFSYYSDTNGIPYSILNAVAMKYVYVYRCLDFFVDNKLTQYLLNNNIPLKINSENIDSNSQYESPLISLYFTEESNTKKISNFNNNSNSNFIKSKNMGKVNNINLNFGNMIGLQNKLKTPTINDRFYFLLNRILYFFIYIKKNINNFYVFQWWYKKTEIKPNDTKKIIEKDYNFNRFIYLGKTSNFSFLQSKQKKQPINGFHSKLLDNLNKETKLQKQVMNYSDYKKMTKIE